MTERPILFSAPLVRAILAGTKTVTRRLVRNPDGWRLAMMGESGTASCYQSAPPHDYAERDIDCPFGAPGDRLWVRENWALHTEPMEGQGVGYTLEYLAERSTRRIVFDTRIYPSGPPPGAPEPWPANAVDRGGRPSIHMPRWASRLTLEVTDVRVERLQDIDPGEVHEEGFRASTRAKPLEAGPLVWNSAYGCWHNDDYDAFCEREDAAIVQAFAALWDSLTPEGSRWADNPWVWAVSFRRVLA